MIFLFSNNEEIKGYIDSLSCMLLKLRAKEFKPIYTDLVENKSNEIELKEAIDLRGISILIKHFVPDDTCR